MNTHKLLSVTNLGLIAFLALFLAKILFFPADGKTPQKASARNTSTENRPDRGPINLPDEFIRPGLFGKINAENDVQISADLLSQSDANLLTAALELRGTITGPPSIARAIIKDVATGQIDIYKIGRQIGEAQIKQIEKNQVVLSYRGGEVILKTGTIQPTAKIPQPQSDVRYPNVSEKLNPAPTFTRRNEMFDEIMRDARFEPYIPDDATDAASEGLQVSGLPDSALADYIGLKNGDVIQYVNGQKFTNKQKAFQILKKARTQPNINIQLLRDRQPETLSFALR